MTEDIGHFKVVLEASVDKDIGKSLEEGFEKSSEKIGRNLQKEIEESIDKSVEKARKFEKSFKIPSFGQIGEKLTSFLGQSTKTITAGGLASAAGGEAAAGASGSGIMAIVGKLSIVVGILALVYDVIKSLAPIVAIFKLISAMLQLTLYPIAQFLLTIFKPILAILLKMFIIPWYTTWGPALTKFFTPPKEGELGKNAALFTLFGPLGIFLKDIPSTIQGIISIIQLMISIWASAQKTLEAIIFGIVNTMISLWSDAQKTLEVIFSFLVGEMIKPFTTVSTWLSSNWSGITNAILSPLQGVWNWITSIKIPSWVPGNRDKGNVPDLPSTPTPPSGKPWELPGWFDLPWGGGMAEGGIVRSPTVSLIGERGPEAVIPLNKLSNMGGVNLTINIAKVEKSVDVNDIINKIERTLYTNMKRAGAR